MTREEILAMKPGRELDALVAEKVMGWRWVEGRHWDVDGIADPIWLLPQDMAVSDVEPGTWTYVESEKLDRRLTLFDLPAYSTDIAAAWEIATHTGGLVLWHDDVGGNWIARFVSIAAAPTAPEAICKARLLTVLEEQPMG